VSRRKNNIVISSTSRLTSAVSDECGSSLTERRAQIGLFSGKVASGKSQDWRVVSDMLPGDGLAEAITPLLLRGVVSRALRPQTAHPPVLSRG